MLVRRTLAALLAGLLLLPSACGSTPPSAGAPGSFQQKIVTLYDHNADEVPESVRNAASPAPWTAPEPLPLAELSVLATSPEGVVWLGGDSGAVRFDPSAAHPWDRWHVFRGRRWLPDDQVEQIVLDTGSGTESAWIRTRTGVSHITWRSMTFEEKAAHYEAIVEARHLRHDFVSESVLQTPGDLSTSVTTDSDNDGLWTAMYLAAQAYQWAATGDTLARRRARRSLDALIRLETITPITGLYARTYRRFDAPLPHQDGGQWHPAGDGETEWKGDTSSDESVGHYYAFSIYHDLVADKVEKPLLAQHVRTLTDYLIDNEYELLDVDGEPTRWGRFSEAYFATPEGDYEKALRSLELLSFLKTTWHLTGDEKYQEAYLDRVHRGYARNTLDYRRWASEEWEINFSDDELYFLSIYPLLKYETDPVLREIYLEGLRFTWTQVQPDRNPLWNFIAVAAGAGPLALPLLDDSRRTLERVPLDMIEWHVVNSDRLDVRLNRNPNRFGILDLNRVLPPDERRIHKHNTSPYTPDGGNSGRTEEAPTFWLLPYWMGRAYSIIV